MVAAVSGGWEKDIEGNNASALINSRIYERSTGNYDAWNSVRLPHTRWEREKKNGRKKTLYSSENSHWKGEIQRQKKHSRSNEPLT